MCINQTYSALLENSPLFMSDDFAICNADEFFDKLRSEELEQERQYHEEVGDWYVRNHICTPENQWLY